MLIPQHAGLLVAVELITARFAKITSVYNRILSYCFNIV